MFRATVVARKISPYVLFVRETTMGKGKKPNFKGIAQQYKKLSPAQMTALRTRANKYPNPYLNFAKKTRAQLSHLPAKEREAQVSRLWREEKSKKVTKVKKPSKASASKKVKKAAKAAKNPKKVAPKKKSVKKVK